MHSAQQNKLRDATDDAIWELPLDWENTGVNLADPIFDAWPPNLIQIAENLT